MNGLKRLCSIGGGIGIFKFPFKLLDTSLQASYLFCLMHQLRHKPINDRV